MSADRRVCDVVNQIVSGAMLPDERSREDLRRELHAHFEDAEDSHSPLDETLERFGRPPDVTESFRHVYRADFLLAYSARLFVSLMVALLVAMTAIGLAHLRWNGSEGISLAAGSERMLTFGIRLALALTAAWEAGRLPFSFRRAAGAFICYWGVSLLLQASFFGGLSDWRRPWHTPAILVVGLLVGHFYPKVVALLAMFVGFSLYYAFVASNSAGLASPWLIGASIVAVWFATDALFSLLDRMFGSRFAIRMDSWTRLHYSGR